MSNWKSFTTSSWRNSIYTDEALNCMSELFRAQLALLSSYGSPATVFIEVGCGTAESFAKLSNKFGVCIGVDFNESMIETALQLHEKVFGPNVILKVGKAEDLTEIVGNLEPKFHMRLVACLMNTLGVFPDSIRIGCVAEMLKVANVDGVVVLGCWHAPAMRLGYEEYYSTNPELCGPCNEADFDFEAGNFKSKSGYSSHWWTQQELESLVKLAAEVAGVGVTIEYQMIGVGIFALVCRQ